MLALLSWAMTREERPIDTNSYSRTWFDTFLETIPSEITNEEAEFLRRVLPLPAHRQVLDLCCGSGRHAVPLTEHGYHVTGVDRDAGALARAEEKLSGTEARFIGGDMRDLSRLRGPFDAALIMWQSFGFFDTGTNLDILGQIADLLRSGGRLVLDLYHRAFFEAHQGARMLESGERHVQETKVMVGNRLHVALDYGDGASDSMEWQLFYPEEIVAFAERAGFRPVVLCSRWQDGVAPSDELPRMQVVLEKARR